MNALVIVDTGLTGADTTGEALEDRTFDVVIAAYGGPRAHSDHVKGSAG
jgi:hypothetical protein